MHDDLLVMPYNGVSPSFTTRPAHAGPGAAVLGRATLGRGAWLGTGSVIRADGHHVVIGDDFRLGARGTVHITHDVLPTHIGDGVMAGVNSIVHACDVGDGCHIGRDVVILDGSKVEAGAAIADGAVAFPRSALEGGWLHAGQPARPVRRLEPGELEALHAASRAEPDEAATGVVQGDVEAAGHLFLAATASVRGRVVAGPEVGIWFGCDLDAGGHVISIGENTNVQDNTVIRCVAAPVTIGRESTVGHNVVMSDCSVGDRSLIGMGAVLAPGTVVEDDVLVAAGARTTEGQRLRSGWLHGGNPARPLSALDERKRLIISGTWPTYRLYGHAFAAEQRSNGAGR